MVLAVGAKGAQTQVNWHSPHTLGAGLPLIVNSNNTQRTRWEQLLIQEFKKAIKSEFPKNNFGKLTITSDVNILLPQCVYSYRHTAEAITAALILQQFTYRDWGIYIFLAHLYTVFCKWFCKYRIHVFYYTCYCI